jgi:hypothetical protein
MSKKKSSQKGSTHVAIVLDASSSIMTYGIRDHLMNAFNARVATLRSQAEKYGQDVRITLVQFADNADLKYTGVPVGSVRPLTAYDYTPWGNTALFDGLGRAIEALKADEDAEAFLVETITDGEENASKYYSSPNSPRWNWTTKDIIQVMKGCSQEGNWTFAFQMPPGKGDPFARAFGIPRECVHEWEATAKGVQTATATTQDALGTYFLARSTGEKSVKTFYQPVSADLSKVKPSDIKRKLTDLSGSLKVWKVDQEAPIANFIAAKSKKEYVIGSAFYEVTKVEKVQPNKDVLVMEKGQKAIWGGPEARKLIGLPDGEHAKLDPLNLSIFRVFVRSTSPNRKLVRGTSVIFDPKHTKPSTPTWTAPPAPATAPNL